MRVLILFLVLFAAYLAFQLYGPSLNLRTLQTVVPVVPVRPLASVQSYHAVEARPAIYKCLISGRTVYSSAPCTIHASVVANHITVIAPVVPSPQSVVAYQDTPASLPVTNEPVKRTDCNPEQAVVEQAHVDLRMCTPMQCEFLRQRLRDANVALDACEFSMR
ncbi:MAG: hypothetical protein HKM01_08380 [Gallionella sp.]|nr:hypothetical protein [Gallionella sp.]